MSRVTRKLLGRNRNKGDRDGSTSATTDLDDEMEKVFAMSENDKFDFSRFSTDVPEQKRERQYNEREINNSHRKRTYPHIHLPLKGLKSHYLKKSNNFNNADKKVENVTDDSKETRDEEVQTAPEERDISFYVDSVKEPILSEKAGALSGRMDASPDRHVQFIVGTSDDGAEDGASRDNDRTGAESRKNLMDHKAKRKYSHHYKKSRKRLTSGDSTKGSGTSPVVSDDVDVDDSGDGVALQIVLQLEEPLHEVVQDDVASHRLDSFRDKRRFSTKTAISSILNKRGMESSVMSSVPIKLYKKIFDHSPHEVFVQLDELTGIGDDREWKETARWIKYEEDVEEGADRWGRPHVASLSFHSLLNLRRCIETGVVLLDLEEKELPGVAYRVVEQMVVDQVIKESEKSTVIRALLLKHRHVCEFERFRFMRRNTASYSSLQGLEELVSSQMTHSANNNFQDDSKNKNKHANSMEQLKSGNHLGTDIAKPKEVTIDLKEETYASSSEDLDKRIQKEKESIMKRIPAGAEATTVLVGTVDFLQEPAIAFVRLAEGIFLPAVTEIPVPVRFMFILLGPQKADVDYHEIGRSMSTLMSNRDFNREAYKATDRRDLLRAINEFLDYSIVLPPDNWERHALLSLRELRAKNEAIRKRRNRLREEASLTTKAPLLPSEEKKDDDPYGDPLRRTKKLFGGLINDVKRRAPYYKSDFSDGLNHQCFSVALFMFFAALSAAIAFGGLFAQKTDHQIGISETLLSTAFCGIVYTLFASQPLLIIGTTGPLLLFDESLYRFCLSNGIEYLTMRLYVGIWLLIIALLVASVEGSVFIKVFTRFTEEIFASLISLIYIYESITMLISLFFRHPLMTVHQYCVLNNQTLTNTTDTESFEGYQPTKLLKNQPNTALFCFILSLGTFFLAFYLRHFRNSKFLGRNVRRAIGDFGVPISIIVFGALAAVTPETYTEKLIVPAGLEPSTRRDWVVPALGVKSDFPMWAMFVAVIPAFLVYILVFMETNISELLIGKKERKLKKGNGFHLDIVLVCCTNVGCAVIGAPWMCAAAVRSLTHLNAVTVMSTTHAPGEKPRIIEVREQRVSGLICSALVGLSVLMAPILRLLPMAVLFGVFLYMGIVSICGIQFIERLKLFLMPVKHHPQIAYVRKVPTYKMYLFTLVQLLCLIILWTVKSSSISLLFPFFLLMMIPLRAQLIYFFTPSELRALDSDEPDVDDKDDDEPDFYEEAVLPG